MKFLRMSVNPRAVDLWFRASFSTMRILHILNFDWFFFSRRSCYINRFRFSRSSTNMRSEFIVLSFISVMLAGWGAILPVLNPREVRFIVGTRVSHLSNRSVDLLRPLYFPVVRLPRIFLDRSILKSRGLLVSGIFLNSILPKYRIENYDAP